ncbi:SulP family inorganic anion transporter [Thiolapillus sp.]
MSFPELLVRLREMLIPTLYQVKELKDPAVLKADLIAGITVALVLVPQSMAYAQLAGLPPYFGLYASFLPPMVAALFGSSRQLATGPVAVVSLLTAASLEPLAAAGSEGFLAYAILLAIMIGIFQLVLGLLRLGVLVDFLSHPVVVGFTNAGAVIIATSQLSKLFGVTVEKAPRHYETVYNIIQEATESTHLITFAFSVLSIAIIWGMKKYQPRLPGVLIAVVVCTLLSWMIGFEARGGAIVGAIPAGLPSMTIPAFDWEVVKQLIASTIVISLIGFMEAISIAKAMAARTRQRIDANQELVGQGLSNVVSGLFGGYAVSGSFSRSAVNIESGAVTGFSSIVTGTVVGITLLFLTPLLYHLPQATLAAVIIMAVINLVKIEPVKHAWKAEKHDGIVAVVTFVLTLVMAPHLEQGIIIGVVLAMVLFIYRTMRPRIAIVSRYHDGTFRDVSVHPELDRCKKILMFRFDMSLYYANAGYFETKVLEMVADNPEIEYLILDAEGINTLDATGEEVLLHLSERLQKVGITIIVARMKKQFMDTLRKTGTLEKMGGDNRRFFSRITFALAQAWANVECDKCDNGKNCPLRTSVAIQQARERGELEPDQPKPVDIT